MTESEIKELFELFKDAETNIKTAELLEREGFSLPAINELRYAFKHLTMYLKDNKAEEFIECKAHITRVICDALEMQILIGFERIKRFDSRYRFVSISPIIPNWVDLRKELEKAKSLLISGDESLERTYNLKEALKLVKSVTDTIEVAKSELNKALFGRLLCHNGCVSGIFRLYTHNI